MDRERLLDMEGRLGPVRRASIGVIALALIACGPWLGWWTLLPLVAAGAASRSPSGGSRARRGPSTCCSAPGHSAKVAIAGAVALTGSIETPMLAWLAIPVVTLSARFSARGVALGVGVALILMFAVASAPTPGASSPTPCCWWRP